MTIHKERFICRPSVRISFGVPLEDVFLDGDVHAVLKQLLRKIFEKYCSSSSSLTALLREEASPLDIAHFERSLDDKLINRLSAPMLVWILRHFFACLPIPLFPKYTDRRHFSWRDLSDLCRISIERHFDDFRCDQYLIDKITTDLLRLPPVNLLLIGYFVNFLRTVTMVNTRGSNKINVKYARTLVNYFGDSLFSRTCGKTSKRKKSAVYHPLMLYLFIKWPEIQGNCIRRQTNCFLASREENIDTIRRKTTEIVPKFCDKHFLDHAGEGEELSDHSFYSLEDSKIHQDIACQTPEEETKKKSSFQKRHDRSMQTQQAKTIAIGTQTSDTDIFDMTKLDGSYVSYKGDGLLYPNIVQSLSKNIETSDFYPSKTLNKNSPIPDIVSTSSMLTLEENIPNREELEMKVLGSGWTYDKDKKFYRESLQSNENAKIEHEDKIKVDEASIKSLPSSNNLNNAEFEEFHELKIPLTKKEARNIFTLSKLKSRLDFMKVFKKKRLAKSTSVEHFNGHVKYEKIGSAQSNTF